MAAEAFYFLLDQKVTKNQASRDASLRSGPCPAVQLKPRAAILLPLFIAQGSRFSKSLLMPLPTRKGHQFYLPSSEAYLLALYL
jgi:hypothetical protein